MHIGSVRAVIGHGQGSAVRTPATAEPGERARLALWPGRLGVIAASAAISAMTLAVHAGVLPANALEASVHAVASGRIWLLATSALAADHPAVPSILGLLLVGLFAAGLVEARILWLAAVAGHLGSALALYGVLAIVRAVSPSSFENVLSLPDYGTSAIIAAWIGVIAYRWWASGDGLPAKTAAAGLCLSAGLVGWLFKPDLTVLDTEHVIALGFGIAVARLGSLSLETAALEARSSQASPS